VLGILFVVAAWELSGEGVRKALPSILVAVYQTLRQLTSRVETLNASFWESISLGSASKNWAQWGAILSSKFLPESGRGRSSQNDSFLICAVGV
jgi:hypothetical protein